MKCYNFHQGSDIGCKKESCRHWLDLEKHNNWPAHLWIQTSYNTHDNQHAEGGTPLRGNYATVGSTWDAENQVFWTLHMAMVIALTMDMAMTMAMRPGRRKDG